IQSLFIFIKFNFKLDLKTLDKIVKFEILLFASSSQSNISALILMSQIVKLLLNTQPENKVFSTESLSSVGMTRVHPSKVHSENNESISLSNSVIGWIVKLLLK